MQRKRSTAAHVCDASCPRLCKHAMKGGGIGMPKRNPAPIGRTVREETYMQAHRWCQCVETSGGCRKCSLGRYSNGCQRASTDCDHIGGRKGGTERDTALIRALCHECHMDDPHGHRVKPEWIAAHA